ncbi:MAG: single-stranded-DNA-specific exonuclease RecJ [Candidatus Yonathbacteria bacterium CG10_big_fil_rev_8_21_14_0_10_43_136]|uniref:Single-stranded-DNA-specific exonuclease RecJ n=2 Tax=Parcubacteria group TaxID=1794811 RepID=A0A2M7Q4N6_9BACT|nr:MAG: single-stranded-DNA-specific exonuclease RecJ [Candidatus Yonathbacteria bacterium CG17_big_fil_post_rev_8_21_14_2_50_43_9]PIR40415.1 MAG: single-stranded-DNA-specific exonuclease RecJ [Candidatus Yonathbacteria bacterium CG10_big_fil_rev_8_21_14_0_10_43_136]PIX57352.1 MAG: single-stranded-DNA-specific exonuclease RecJ [Candidatus Yonathbacteria bacterium CG_4_10_14_3_um_filter_43_12]PIY58169.1 MAG: single-stranded-DNA-specific exonuclease RecJ [Candidatus Yonathbacteria bacterium CG_4_1
MPSDLSSCPDLAQMLLKKRGITNAGDAEHFLYPDFERDVRDPFGILNMEKAVERILCAIDTNERIAIYADYDCDGIPGATIFYDFLKKIKYENFEVYIPHRNIEGYGLNNKALDALAERGATVVITIDCGIVDIEEADHARKLGIDLIVTDHHLPQDILPKAYAIINSKQAGDTYHDKMLCGAGVAWKLVCALLARRGEVWGVPKGWEKWLLDMAGISTIADMVPLRNENRALAKYGLVVLRKSRRPGLLALLQKMDMNQANIVEDDIGFMIGPRINAASRMGEPMDAFRLLSAETREEADEYAEKLMHLNDARKGLVASMVKEAHKHLEGRTLREIIVIGNPMWKPGLVGLVAMSLVKKYERTIFVWGRTESGEIKGSCRSDGTVHVVDMMTSVPEGVFIDVGGHEEAGGFSVSSDAVHTLEDELVKAYQLARKEKENTELSVDMELALSEVNWVNWKQIEKFAPFGTANPKPVFLFEKVKIAEARFFGKEKTHLELSFDGSGIKAILFFADSGKYKILKAGVTVDLVATMEVNTFRNNRELRLRIVEVVKKM